MKPIRTKRLILRNWEDRDRAFFHRINSDDIVMAFYDIRRGRAEADAMMDRLRADVAARGYGFCAAEHAETGETVGFIGISPVEIPPYLPAGTTEIGWRLAPEHWGKGYVAEAAGAWLDFAFDTLDLAEVVAFAVWNNVRSTRVMERLGMRRDAACDFDHPRVVEPRLKRHVLYRMPRQVWRDMEKAAS